MNAIYNLTAMNPADYEDLFTVMGGASDYLRSENIMCNFLRKMYHIEAYDILHEEDMREAMDAHGYATTCAEISHLYGDNLLYTEYGYERYSQNNAEDDFSEVVRSDWSLFCRKVEEYAATNPAMSPVLAVVRHGWTAEAVAEYCGGYSVSA